MTRALLLGDHCAFGTYHFADRGRTTWFGFAQAIFQLAETFGRRRPHLQPIPSTEYATQANRPANSTLDTRKFTEVFQLVPPDWADSLTHVVAEILTKGRTSRTAVR